MNNFPRGTQLTDPPFDYRDEMADDDIVWQIEHAVYCKRWHEIGYWAEIMAQRVSRAKLAQTD